MQIVIQPSSSAHQKWAHTRIARLAFLVGCGLDSRDIGADPEVAAKPATVRRQARRLGLALRSAKGARLPYAVLSRFDAAAARRGIAREALIHRVLLQAGSEDALIDNILDDHV